jgi:hypothetical protein
MNSRIVAVLLLAGSVLLSGQAGAKTALDSQLFANFNIGNNVVQFLVCGELPQTEGCFTEATLSPPFERACAVLQGVPKTKGNVMTRAIYVLDKRTSPGNPVQLYVYTRKDTLTDTDDIIKVTLQDVLALAITGGSSSHCSMAADKKFLFAATDANPNAIRVSKSDLSMLTFNGGNSGGVTSITADDRGFIALNLPGGQDIIYNGFTFENGGFGYMVGTDNAFLAH